MASAGVWLDSIIFKIIGICRIKTSRQPARPPSRSPERPAISPKPQGCAVDCRWQEALCPGRGLDMSAGNAAPSRSAHLQPQRRRRWERMLLELPLTWPGTLQVRASSKARHRGYWMLIGTLCNPDARFEVLGSPYSLLSVTLSASQKLYTRRGTLVTVAGKVQNVGRNLFNWHCDNGKSNVSAHLGAIDTVSSHSFPPCAPGNALSLPAHLLDLPHHRPHSYKVAKHDIHYPSP